MKTMNLKTASVALLLTLFAVSVSAQGSQQRRAPHAAGKQRPAAEKVAEVTTDKLDQSLELTDAQEKQIYAINLKYAQSRTANAKAQRETRLTPEQRKDKAAVEASRKKMLASRKEAQTAKRNQMIEIMSTLSDEQKVDYAQFIAKATSKRMKHAHNQGAHAKKSARSKSKGQCNNTKKGHSATPKAKK